MAWGMTSDNGLPATIRDANSTVRPTTISQPAISALRVLRSYVSCGELNFCPVTSDHRGCGCYVRCGDSTQFHQTLQVRCSRDHSANTRGFHARLRIRHHK